MVYSKNISKAVYDVIIIGSGMAGLSCGANLAAGGLSVLVLEQHFIPGGGGLNSRNCIKYGLTTVRDMGAFPNSIQEWKRKINSGEAVGPRVYTPNTFITSKDGPPERFTHVPFPVRLMKYTGLFTEIVELYLRIS